MTHLTHASRELFRRSPDERFPSLEALWQHCHSQKEASLEHWETPQRLVPKTGGEILDLSIGDDGAYALNDWSFGQLCRLCSVSKETLNRLSSQTASHAICETLPTGTKPLQLLTQQTTVRSIHGVAYTRLFNADLVALVRECATDFAPPPKGFNGATGLYAGEQDMFCFLIDPTGWAEIGDQAFAPGFFLWNSEVGRRSVGISTFWFQSVCQNHIVWDATEIVDFTRKHTANVNGALAEIRGIIKALVAKRDARLDGFVAAIRAAMETSLGDDAEDVLQALAKAGITRELSKRAVKIAEQQGHFTIFSLVDTLTRITRELTNAGERTEADQKVAKLLTLAV